MHRRSSAYHPRPGYPEAEKAACFENCRDDYSCCRLRAQFSKRLPLFTGGKVENGRKLVHMGLTSLYKTLYSSTWKSTKVSYTDRILAQAFSSTDPESIIQSLESTWRIYSQMWYVVRLLFDP